MVYECDQCSKALPPGVTACPSCGETFEDAVPADAEVPKRGFSAAPSSAAPHPDPVPTQSSSLSGVSAEGNASSNASSNAYGPASGLPANQSQATNPWKKPITGSQWLFFIAVIVVVWIYLASSHSASSDQSSSSDSPTVTSPAVSDGAVQAPAGNSPIVSAPAPAFKPAPALKWVDVVEFEGDGIKKTAPFTVGDHWKIEWKTKPGAMGPMNFQIFLYSTDSDAPADVAANVVGASQDGTDEYKAGTYYLQMNTAQPYVVRILDLR